MTIVASQGLQSTSHWRGTEVDRNLWQAKMDNDEKPNIYKPVGQDLILWQRLVGVANISTIEYQELWDGFFFYL
jgi:hypothetical protein